MMNDSIDVGLRLRDSLYLPIENRSRIVAGDVCVYLGDNLADRYESFVVGIEDRVHSAQEQAEVTPSAPGPVGPVGRYRVFMDQVFAEEKDAVGAFNVLGRRTLEDLRTGREVLRCSR